MGITKIFLHKTQTFYNTKNSKSMVIFTNAGSVVLLAVIFHQAIFTIPIIAKLPPSNSWHPELAYPWEDLSFCVGVNLSGYQ